MGQSLMQNVYKVYHKPPKRSFGQYFEKDVVDVFTKAFCNSKTFRVVSCIGTKADKQEGTDFTIGEIRFDITTNIDNKKCMPFIADTGIKAIRDCNFRMGIRVGNEHNGYTEFEDPVVVIGLGMPSDTLKQYKDAVLESLYKNATDLVCFASDCLEDYNTRSTIERAYLDNLPLRVNPKFRKPKDMSETLSEQIDTHACAICEYEP